MPKDESNPRKKADPDPPDLAERLARYRARVEREGRRSALERLDRAIAEARREPAKPKLP